jgi:hypothetical protein
MVETKQRDTYDDPAHWRARAKQARELALTVTDKATLEKLERRALEYESLADTLERNAQSPV